MAGGLGLRVDVYENQRQWRDVITIVRSSYLAFTRVALAPFNGVTVFMLGPGHYGHSIY